MFDDVTLARFWSKVEQRNPGECWPWKGARRHDGRGRIRINDRHLYPSRVALAIATGQMPDDQFACRSCDNPNCVNPSHLWWGTNTDNMRDASAKGRFPKQQKTECYKGHPFDGTNTAIDSRGWRVCRECSRLKRRKGYVP